MTDLSTISDDDLVSEIARRELHKRNGVFTLMSTQMLDYHSMHHQWCLFSARLDAELGFMHPLAFAVRTELLRIVNAHSPSYQPQSVNTTYRGAEDRIHEIARAA